MEEGRQRMTPDILRRISGDKTSYAALPLLAGAVPALGFRRDMPHRPGDRDPVEAGGLEIGSELMTQAVRTHLPPDRGADPVVPVLADTLR